MNKIIALLFAVAAVACADEVSSDANTLVATISVEGGSIVGDEDTPFEGFSLQVPAGALTEASTIEVTVAEDLPPLPDDARAIGTQFHIDSSAALVVPARLVLPFEPDTVSYYDREITEVKVWVKRTDGWALVEPAEVGADSVTILLDEFIAAGAGLESLE